MLPGCFGVPFACFKCVSTVFCYFCWHSDATLDELGRWLSQCLILSYVWVWVLETPHVCCFSPFTVSVCARETAPSFEGYHKFLLVDVVKSNEMSPQRFLNFFPAISYFGHFLVVEAWRLVVCFAFVCLHFPPFFPLSFLFRLWFAGMRKWVFLTWMAHQRNNGFRQLQKIEFS